MRVLFIGFVLFGIGCQSSTYKGNDETIEKVGAGIFHEVISQGGLLLDVRTPEEYAEGHLEGSQNVDILQEDFVDKVNNMDKTQTAFVYCRSGGRSKNAANILATAGFTKIFDLKGGIGAWQEEGFAVVQ